MRNRTAAQANLVSGARNPRQASFDLKLFNEDGSPFAGGGDVLVHAVSDLPEQDLEAADPLVLSFAVEEGDLVEFVSRIEYRANGDPVGEQPSFLVTDNSSVGMFVMGSLPSGINMTPVENTWVTQMDQWQDATYSLVSIFVGESGLLSLELTLNIAAVPVPVDVRNWRVIARRYLSGGG